MLNRRQLMLIKFYAASYEVPWQIAAGVLESEIELDTNWKDPLETWAMWVVPVLTYLRPNGAGPGVGNIHIPTAKAISSYFANEYSDNPVMQLSWHTRSDASVAWRLAADENNIKTAVAYVKMLADYRFGQGGRPSKTDHSDLSAWTMADAVAIWHGYRYGVRPISPGGSGFRSLRDFQNRTLSYNGALAAGVYTGQGNPNMSIAGSVPIFNYFMNQDDTFFWEP